EVPQYVGEGGWPQVGHAGGVQRRAGVQRIDGDDVGVLQPGQPLRLAQGLGGDLQGHEPVGQVTLSGQVDAAERAAAQLGQQVEAEEGAADLGQLDEVAGAVAEQGGGDGGTVQAYVLVGVAPGIEGDVRSLQRITPQGRQAVLSGPVL